MNEELKLFLEDMDEQLSIMEQTLLDISEISIEDIDKEMINKLFRAMHTMKGNAGMFGYDVITEFAHIAENLLDEIRNDKIQINQEILTLFLLIHDHSKILIEVFTHDNNLNEEQNKHHLFLLEELEKCLLLESESSIKIEIENDTNNEELTYNIKVVLKNDFFKSGMDIISVIKYLDAIGEVTKVNLTDDNVPTIDEINPLNAYLSFDIVYKTDEDKDEIIDAFEFVMEDIELSITEVDDVPILPLKEIEENTKANEKSEIKSDILSKDNEVENLEIGEKNYTLKVDSIKIDKLINQISEMVIANAKINQFTQSFKNSELEESLTIMSEMLDEIRDGIMNIRMVQVGDSLSKLRRVVNEIAKKTNKEINFEIIGGETELDKTVIEKISDPLVHMLRNSIDHGIEPPLRRLELGKSEKGNIILKAYPDSGTIVIKISDDGIGLNKEEILKKAINKGLIKEKASLSDKEIFNLIFTAGFSTKETISDISGRGVGMDVVKKNIESLRGSVEVESELNIGTTIIIRLPLTLAIINGFLVQSGKVKYIIPVDSIQECIEVTKSRKEQISKNGYVILRDIIVPIIDISDYFNEDKDDTRENIVVVRYGEDYVGLKVNTLFGEYQTVIKPLGEIFESVVGISGGTILGNGEIALILDIQKLIYNIKEKEFNYGN